MNTLFGPFEATTRSAVLLCSSRSWQHTTPRHITGYLFRHNHHYTTKSHQQQHKVSAAFPHQGRRYSTTSKKTSDPLHILFCGSDDFSCASLKALHDEHVRNPDLIRSIDVVVRPGKRTGRGYKIVRDPPVRSLASSLGLQIHERDTFTGWNMPAKTNLIIAVSFGLFVPPRLLRTAKYGGLNLHPSLLPDLRGPAPLQHTLLAGREMTGVSLQTLDHAAFDHGVVLAQTPRDPTDALALRIPPACTTVAALQALVTPIATQMLIDGLRAGLHVPPQEPQGQDPDPAAAPLTHAPKITKRDRQLTLPILQACDDEEARIPAGTAPGTLTRRQAAIGPLWFLSRDRQGRQKRIILEAVVAAAEPTTTTTGLSRTNRPSMMAFSTKNHHNTTNTRQETPSPHKKYLIPFEEEQEGDRQQQPRQEQNGSEQQHLPGVNLVFWDLADSPSAAPRGVDDGLWLGNYRILSLKVEGEKAKPARQALHNFIIN
ncbi:formyl transferase [Ustulina deusta]|nr:formyl transferase [Ustulina deusta]